MLKKHFSPFAIATIAYLLIFLADYLYELFGIDKTSTIVTWLGLKIETVMTNTFIHTNFILTWKILLTYLIFIIIWFIFYKIMNSVKSKVKK